MKGEKHRKNIQKKTSVRNNSNSFSWSIEKDFINEFSISNLEVDNQENNNFLNENISGVRMKGILQRYRNYLCGEYRKKNTITNYFNRAKQFYCFVHGNIDQEHIQQWRIWANNHYRRKNSLIQNIQAINIFLDWSGKPHLRMKIPQIEDSNEYSLTEKEYEELLIKARQDHETHLIIQLLDHLVRPNDIIQIKQNNRDKDILYLDDTKTGNNHIIMNTVLQHAWDEYLKIRPIPVPHSQDYLLICNEPKWRGHRYRTTLPIRNRVYELGRQANISKRVKPYTIRRTSITLKLDKNSQYFVGDPKLVQMMARHRKLSTTMKYDRKDDNDIRNYHKSLNNITTKKPDSKSNDKKYSIYINNSYAPPQHSKQQEEEPENSTWSFSFSLFSSLLKTQPERHRAGRRGRQPEPIGEGVAMSLRECVLFIIGGLST